MSSTGRVRRAALHTYIPIYQRWIPVPLITADLFRRVVLSAGLTRGRGFDSRSVTFPLTGFDKEKKICIFIIALTNLIYYFYYIGEHIQTRTKHNVRPSRPLYHKSAGSVLTGFRVKG